MENNSYIQLLRLVIFTYDGKISYDENFHSGVNIIRGHNSSGKSTIANFIFYVLGGDYNNWATEARKCSYVYAEVLINGATLTFKREVSDKLRQPLQIFWGNYVSASKSSTENWQIFPYQQTDSKNSFTNIIFNLLGFPEIKGGDSNITMHQILRLLYIDQDSPTQSLFRFEQFDLPITRQAISELLLGIYDDSLYNDRLKLKSLKKEHDELKKELEGIKKLYKASDINISKSVIDNEIIETENELNKTIAEIEILREKDIVRFSKNSQLESEKIQKNLIPIKNKINTLSSDIEFYQNELIDSERFILSLERRLDAIDNSILTRENFGELPLSHCPKCLSPITNEIQDGLCSLCKEILSEKSEITQAKKIKQELTFQLIESKGLYKSKQTKYQALIAQLTPLQEEARALQRELNYSLRSAKTTRDEKMDNLLVYKGNLDSKIEYLTLLLKTSDRFEYLKNEVLRIENEIGLLNFSIEEKELKQRTKFSEAQQTIVEFTKYLLSNDLKRQDEFRNPINIAIDYFDNAISLDGKFNFSASSNIYFKNSVRFALFFSSLTKLFFRFPRFIICDNMEDKGMEEERSKNFQNVITKLSETYSEKQYQLIFTTSMVSDELNNAKFCIGEFYTEDNKTLKNI